MPELSEIRIMSEFINSKSSGIYYQSARKSEEKKSNTDLSPLNENGPFRINADSRGKELRLTFDFNGNKRTLFFMMGMSANWFFVSPGEVYPKHTHLIFKSNAGTLCLHDMRRFARWKWSDNWGADRGPDPVKEHQEFIDNILNNLSHRDFQKPMMEVIMNQKWFNGIGNYLRAEILGRIDGNPLWPAWAYIEKFGDQLMFLCKQMPQEAYILGGGQFKDWYNYEDQQGEKWSSFQDWIKFYQRKDNALGILDKTGRRFWIDRKWEKFIQ